jgi:hypothetical protein
VLHVAQSTSKSIRDETRGTDSPVRNSGVIPSTLCVCLIVIRASRAPGPSRSH